MIFGGVSQGRSEERHVLKIRQAEQAFPFLCMSYLIIYFFLHLRSPGIFHFLFLAFAQPITALDDGLGIVIRVLYFHRNEFFLERFIQWIRLSCIRAHHVFLFQLSVCLRFIQLYSRHFLPGIFHFAGFLMFCRETRVNCKCYVTLVDSF